MKPIVTAAAFAAACLAVPVALDAQSHATSGATASAMHGSGQVTLAQWSTRVSREIDRRVRYPDIPSNEAWPEGVVQVKFRCSDSGASDQVSIFKTSGSRSLDRAAIQAVKSLKQLHPLVSGIGPEQNYIALVLFATSREGHAEQMALIEKDAKKRNAWFKSGLATASAGIMLAPVGS